jgi:hypothetical protein
VDHACTALSRIVESYARYPERLEMLCNNGLITNAVQLVRTQPFEWCCRLAGPIINCQSISDLMNPLNAASHVTPISWSFLRHHAWFHRTEWYTF